MKKTTIFLDGGCQAVHLTDELAFPQGVNDVVVLREGNRRVIVPANAVWDDFFEEPGIDIGEREQPPMR